jgi:hypothetical protein
VVNGFLNFFVDVLKHQVFQLALEGLLLEHLEQRGVQRAHAVMPGEPQVSEVLDQVVHYDNFVFEQRFQLPVHYFEGLPSDSCVVFYPLLALLVLHEFHRGFCLRDPVGVEARAIIQLWVFLWFVLLAAT